LKFVEHGMAALESRIDELFSKKTLAAPGCEVDVPSQLRDMEVTLVSELRDMATRVQRIELLLLRTPLPDFKTLDEAIANMSPAFNSHTQDVSSATGPWQKIVGDSEVGTISIDPDYLSQLCFDETEIQTTIKDVDHREVHEGEVCPACCSSLPRHGQDNQMPSIQLYPCPCCDILCCSLSCYSGHCKMCTEQFSREHFRVDREDASKQTLPTCIDSDSLEDLDGSESGEDALDAKASCSCSELRGGCSESSWSSWAPWWLPISADAKTETSTCTRRPSALKPPPHICCAAVRTPHASLHKLRFQLSMHTCTPCGRSVVVGSGHLWRQRDISYTSAHSSAPIASSTPLRKPSAPLWRQPRLCPEGASGPTLTLCAWPTLAH